MKLVAPSDAYIAILGDAVIAGDIVDVDGPAAALLEAQGWKVHVEPPARQKKDVN